VARRPLPSGSTGRQELAQKAVALQPTGPYFETLAEVCFQSGDKAGALAAIDKAIELDPKNRNWPSQKARFEAGDPNQPLPEGR
jgi:tetratricopeptide (TPR) repeat protein